MKRKKKDRLVLSTFTPVVVIDDAQRSVIDRHREYKREETKRREQKVLLCYM